MQYVIKYIQNFTILTKNTYLSLSKSFLYIFWEGNLNLTLFKKEIMIN